jgi:hypothetical protein
MPPSGSSPGIPADRRRRGRDPGSAAAHVDRARRRRGRAPGRSARRRSRARTGQRVRTIAWVLGMGAQQRRRDRVCPDRESRCHRPSPRHRHRPLRPTSEPVGPRRPTRGGVGSPRCNRTRGHWSMGAEYLPGRGIAPGRSGRRRRRRRPGARRGGRCRLVLDAQRGDGLLGAGAAFARRAARGVLRGGGVPSVERYRPTSARRAAGGRGVRPRGRRGRIRGSAPTSSVSRITAATRRPRPR